MPKHTTTQTVTTHTLELFDAEAYQIWYLSYVEEVGGDYPDRKRVSGFFDEDTQARFRLANSRSVTPVAAFNNPEVLS